MTGAHRSRMASLRTALYAPLASAMRSASSSTTLNEQEPGSKYKGETTDT